MQNSGKTTFKRTSIDHLMNVLVLCVSLMSMHTKATHKLTRTPKLKILNIYLTSYKKKIVIYDNNAD